MNVPKDVATQLKDAGIELKSVDAVIWRCACFGHIFHQAIHPVASHGHFDHTGKLWSGKGVK